MNEIAYSDGRAVETRILSLLKEAKELGSGEMIAHEAYDEWPVRYHLSPERSNLVKHLDFSGLDVLELGAGMGAVSRFVAETARSLTVIEGTESRFRALSARLRDLKNWKGVVANIQDAKLEQKFDVVCVFGVLEYSELYLKGENAFLEFLKIARGHLKEGGALVVAIENQLGLKYWSGAAEDHTGLIYDGIAGYPLGPSPKTFSRKELKALLTHSGLTAIEEHFPFPDYKIPSSVLSLELLETAPELAADIAATQPYQNYGQPRLQAFPDALAARTVARAGLLPDLANSFLFVAAEEREGAMEKLLSRARKSHEVGWHYSSARKVPVRTTFTRVGGEIHVAKSSAEAQKRLGSGEIQLSWNKPEDAPAAPGMKLKARLQNHAYFGEWEAFEREFYGFLDWAVQRFRRPGGALEGTALDATFINAAQSPDGYALFDLEWTFEKDMPLSWYVFRNVCLLASDFDYFSGSAPFSSLGELYVRCCERLGTKPELEKDIERELVFQSLVTRQGARALKPETVRALFQAPFGTPPYLRSPRAFQWLGHRKLGQLVSRLKRVPGLERLAKTVLK